MTGCVKRDKEPMIRVMYSYDPHPEKMPHQGTQGDGRLGLNFALDILSALKI